MRCVYSYIIIHRKCKYFRRRFIFTALTPSVYKHLLIMQVCTHFIYPLTFSLQEAPQRSNAAHSTFSSQETKLCSTPLTRKQYLYVLSSDASSASVPQSSIVVDTIKNTSVHPAASHTHHIITPQKIVFYLLYSAL